MRQKELSTKPEKVMLDLGSIISINGDDYILCCPRADELSFICLTDGLHWGTPHKIPIAQSSFSLKSIIEKVGHTGVVVVRPEASYALHF